jgi:prophage regulatory protein
MKYMRVKSVAEALNVCESTIWRLSKKGILPKPIKLAPRTTVWRVSDIEAAIESLASGGHYNG